MRKVSRSGFKTMSDSSIRTNPSMAEPSNRMSPDSALSNWLSGTSKFLLTPRISVNWSRRNATPCSRQRLRISRFVAPVVFSIVAVMAQPGWQRPERPETAATPRPPQDSVRSDVVVQEELVGVRPQGHRVDLFRPLVGQPGLDQVGRKHTALEQK